MQVNQRVGNVLPGLKFAAMFRARSLARFSGWLLVAAVCSAGLSCSRSSERLPSAAEDRREGLSYVDIPDRSFHWSVAKRERTPHGEHYELEMVSQRWRGTPWKHRLTVLKPEGERTGTALLILRPENEGPGNGELEWLAAHAHAPCAILTGVPNVPLSGRSEDELMAYSLEQYLKTGEPDWPLSLPMVKSVGRAMDALESLSQAEFGSRIQRFVVAGHSKRGGTAWLSAAVDVRVAGIAPIGYELVNIPAQLEHLLKCWPDAMQQNATYRAIADQLSSPRGQRLVKTFDPYSYAGRLHLPKLVVCGTRDEFVPIDSLNLYINRLPGTTLPLFLSGANHAQEASDQRLWQALAMMVRRLEEGHQVAPEITWTWQPRGVGYRLIVAANERPHKATLWQTSSASRDFRRCQWSGQSLQSVTDSDRQFEVLINEPQRGFTAAYAEIELIDETPGLTGAMPQHCLWCTTPCIVGHSANTP
ncbi:MAG TPA: PhoPQ-activated protein PqaA family protein [Pirellulales bacterium]|nr:PhoPQ-activated protein PqaA family protein [Pirellulales bacterium]